MSAFVLVVVGVRLYVGNSTSDPAVTIVDVKVPEFSQVAALGARDFEANCVSCHGENASGTENGPPLVHNIYRPGHHPDYAFRTAAKAGVRAHHWRFGNMPPQPEVTAEEINRIIVYVRELQKENGIL
ncbi:c-type cytochrome [Rhodobium gokarnense]|uniref:Cytochrome c2 n=1 Tax=Rhodobium gokarnense TaxID=364296 RepID=A0ABT3HG67_9HYPH|nr:cytochrome c [Rhodobium gokarnense]MCW2309388.1 cytochrome c2 [Rhodobium gokarnense]